MQQEHTHSVQKVRTSIRLTSATALLLKEIAQREERSQTAIVERALRQYARTKEGGNIMKTS